jgi:malate permease and related proteins
LQLFFSILTDITLPILGLVAVGFAVQKRFSLHIPTLARIQLYVLAPGALIYFPTAAKLPIGAVWPIVWFSALQFPFLLALGWVGVRAAGGTRNVAGLVALTTLYANSGNYGIPLIQLTFPEDYLLYQTVILSLQSLTIVPVALLLLPRTGDGHASVWRTLFSSPLLPAAALGYILKGFEVALPQILALPLRLVSGAFTPMALLLLGVQLAAVNVRVERMPLLLGIVLRMLVAPASAWLFASLLGFSPDLIAFFVISAAVPVGVMVSIFASEFRTEPELASMLVFISTVLSSLTVTGWVYAVRYAGLQ